MIKVRLALDHQGEDYVCSNTPLTAPLAANRKVKMIDCHGFKLTLQAMLYIWIQYSQTRSADGGGEEGYIWVLQQFFKIS